MPDDQVEASGVDTEQADDLDTAIAAAMGDVEPETEASEPSQTRDDKGRFAKADESGDDEVEASEDETAADAEDEGQEPSEPEPELEPEKLEAPGHWPREDREAFEKFDRATQELLVARDKAWEAANTRKSQEFSEKAKFADDVQGLFDEATRNQMALQGMDERAAIRQLVASHQYATRDPVGYIKWFANGAGIDLGQLAPRAEGEDHEMVDPSFQPIVSRLDGIEQQVNGFFQTQAQSQQSAINHTIQTFRDATGDDGTPLHPHFDKLKVRMGALMEYDPGLKAMPDGPEKLGKAYDMALFTDPDLRQQSIDAEAAKAIEADRKKAEADKARRAKAPSGTTPSGSKPKEPEDLDGIIAAEMAAHA